MPKSRKAFWGPKLLGNVERDEKSRRLLEEDGWGILVLWECELKDVDALRARIVDFLEGNGEKAQFDLIICGRGRLSLRA